MLEIKNILVWFKPKAGAYKGTAVDDGDPLKKA